MPLHGFVYTRALIFILGTMGPSRDFVKNVNSPFVYAESVLGAALISVGHCHGSWPIPVYLIFMHLIGKISLWVGEQHDYCRSNGVPESTHVKILRSAGFWTRESYTKADSAPRIGFLTADIIGEKYTKHI